MTQDKELEVSHLSGYMGVTEKIKRAMYDAAKQFVYIGFLLWEVQEYGYYKEGGYKDVYDYAAQELNFKKSSVKNFIAISYQFGSADHRALNGAAHVRTMSLQQPYEKFKYSQLCEMLSMTEKQREQVKPDMTVKQIRQLKKDLKQEQPKAEQTSQTSGYVPLGLPEPLLWHDAEKETPKPYDRKLKLVIIEYRESYHQYGIGYYNAQEDQWHDQTGNKIKVTYWMPLPYMPE